MLQSPSRIVNKGAGPLEKFSLVIFLAVFVERIFVAVRCLRLFESPSSQS